jgi:hypothetical protein
MGPALLPLAGLAAAGIAGDAQVRREQRDILNRQFGRTSDTLNNTSNQIVGEGQKYDPTTRLADMQKQEDATFDQSQKDLAGANANAIPTAGDAGAVSSEFLNAKADRTLSEGNRMTAIARELAKVRAPGQLMSTEGIRRAGVQGDVAGQWGKTRRMGDAAQMAAADVQEPWWATLGKMGTKLYTGAAMSGMV